MDKILVETDAPYLAPVPKRGRENKTAYTRYVVDFIADLRGMAVEEIAQATYDNAKSLFGLSDLVEQGVNDCLIHRIMIKLF